MIPMPDNFPELYTQGHTVMHALRAGGLRPIRYKAWEAERTSIGELAELCNMGRSTMYKRIGEYRARLYREGDSRS